MKGTDLGTSLKSLDEYEARKKRNAIIGSLLIIVPVVAWYLFPAESTKKGEIISATVIRYEPGRGNKASPKPYYSVKLENGMVVKVPDYGVARPKIGDKVQIQEYIGKHSNFHRYQFIRK